MKKIIIILLLISLSGFAIKSNCADNHQKCVDFCKDKGGIHSEDFDGQFYTCFCARERIINNRTYYPYYKKFPAITCQDWCNNNEDGFLKISGNFCYCKRHPEISYNMEAFLQS